jgi:hypothetical protein
MVDNALSLLLEGEGCTTRIIQEERLLLGLVDGLLESVHIVLLTPALSNDVRDTLLSVVRGNPKTAAMPVLMLSTTEKEVLNTRTARVVPWAYRLEDLRQAIETALTPASQMLLAEGAG